MEAPEAHRPGGRPESAVPVEMSRVGAPEDRRPGTAPLPTKQDPLELATAVRAAKAEEYPGFYWRPATSGAVPLKSRTLAQAGGRTPEQATRQLQQSQHLARICRLTVHLMPGSVIREKEWLQTITIEASEDSTGDDIREQLVRTRHDWGPLAPPCWGAIHEAHNVGIERCRMLHKGMPLKLKASLKDQGVVDGSVLRVLRPSSQPWRALETPSHALPNPSPADVPKRFQQRHLVPLVYGQMPQGQRRARPH